MSSDYRSLKATILRRILTYVWPRPEPELVHAGREGEIVIAKGRLLVVSLLLLPGIATCVRNPAAPSGWIALCMAVLCICIGAEILRRARAAHAGALLQLSTSLLDISLVSVFHVVLFLAGQYDMIFNSRVTFSVYIIAIAGTALRFDARLVRVAGAMAIAQYLAIIAWANESLRAETSKDHFYGDTSLGGQLEEVGMLIITTALGAVIVERARQLRLSGIRDPLTKLANRSYFFDRAAIEVQTAVQSKTQVALAVIDLDHFKQINDTYGHIAGDMVLKEVSRCLQQSLGRHGLIARLGGEEFIALVRNTDPGAAIAHFESTRKALHALNIHISPEAHVHVTASIGIAMFPVDGDDIAQLVEIADARLLAGKRAGRDRIVAASMA